MVLIVDDEPLVRRALARSLRRHDLGILEAADAEEALSVLERSPVDLLIADQRLPAESGIELLSQVRTRWPEVERVLITGVEDMEVAREAINRAGVSYFLGKPWEEEAIARAVRELAERRSRTPAPSPRVAGPSAERSFPGMIGRSKPMRELFELVSKVAETDSTALVTGETGTGKELVGRAIHQASRRRNRVFCAVNSAAFPETLLESELFGHRRGAFTGASANNKGLFEHADKGTVFLDEVAEMPLSMQA